MSTSTNTVKSSIFTIEEGIALQDFREAVKGIPNLVCPLDDDFLLKFLRARKNEVKDATKLLQQYYKMKKQNASMLRSICPMNFRQHWKPDGHTIVLKHRDRFGRKIIYQRTGMWKPEEITFEQLLIMKFYILEEVLCSPETQNNGVILISDDSGLNFSLGRRLLYEFNFKRMRLLINFLQGAFLGRFKGFHAVNNTFAFQIIFNVIKTVLTEKFQKRCFVHGHKFEELHKHFSPDILPECLGGLLTIEEATDSDLMETLFVKATYYKDLMDKFGYQESGTGNISLN